MQLPSGLNLDVAGSIIVLGAFLVALCIVLFTFISARNVARNPDTLHPYELKDCMGSAQWDFTKSWASTLTVIGALLGTVLSAVKNDPAQYILLNLFFVLLALVAPLVYNFIGKMEPVGISPMQRDVSAIAHRNQPGQPAPLNLSPTYQYQGYIVGFLAACTLTLWAVIGEVVTLTFLLGVLQGLMPRDPFLISIQTLFLLSAVVVGYYGWKTIPFTLQAQVSHRKASIEQKAYLMKNYSMTEDEARQPAQPSWSLL